MVPAEGCRDASIVLIGESPGKQEAAKGRPFIGPSWDKRLLPWLTAVGLQRSDLYITNVIKDYYGATTDALPKNLDLRPHFESLLLELAQCHPKVVVPCGTLALVALWHCCLFKLPAKYQVPQPIAIMPQFTKRGKWDWRKERKLPPAPHQPITVGRAKGALAATHWRGSVMPISWPGGRTVALVPTLHPAVTFREAYLEGRCRSDWKRIAEVARMDGPPTPPKRTHRVAHTDTWNEWVAGMPVDALVAVDLETTRPGQVGHPNIKCVGLSYREDCSLIVPAHTRNVIDPLRKFLEVHASRLVFHNGLFDLYWLTALGGVKASAWWLDTLAMHHALDPAEGHDLEYLASIYTWESYWKDIPDSGKPEDLWLYCGLDTCVTLELAHLFLIQLRVQGRLEFYRQYYGAMFPALRRLMLAGCTVDEGRRSQQADTLRVGILEMKNRLLAGRDEATLFGGGGGLSNTKLRSWFHTLGLPRQYSRKTGHETLDETAIRNLIRRAPGQAAVCKAVLGLRQQQKLLEFLDPAAVDPDGRMRATFAPFAETGRLRSSGNPFGTGRNMQNISR